MPAYLTFSNIDLAPLDAASRAELQALAAEAMGWQSLAQGVYLHLGNLGAQELIIQVVGIPDAAMAGMNVRLVG